MVKTLKFLPQPARQAIFEKVPAPYGVIAVYAGETEAVHNLILEKCFQQLAVPVEGQSDIVIYPIPYISPYNVGAFLNPLLVSVMAEGYLHNLHRGVPLLKGGTIIITHPCTDKFDREQHLAYVEFFHKLLPQTRDAVGAQAVRKDIFEKIQPTSRCTARARPIIPSIHFICGIGAKTADNIVVDVIVVGADNEYIPKDIGLRNRCNHV